MKAHGVRIARLIAFLQKTIVSFDRELAAILIDTPANENINAAPITQKAPRTRRFLGSSVDNESRSIFGKLVWFHFKLANNG